jgi:photosystem II stability/assembly factor-like uncharacterized protein
VKKLAFLATVCLLASTLLNGTGGVAQVRTMKLIGPQTGWALAGQRLYWTRTDGRAWTDITPPESQGQSIDGVFFLNSSHGWTVISGRGPTAPGGLVLKVLRTLDGGHSWGGGSIDTSVDKRFRIYAGGASIFFLDAARGWINLRLMSSSNFSFGLLFSTDDGGQTWSELPPPPAADPVHFVTPRDGWIAGGPGGGQLWYSGDAGKSWERRSIPMPVPCARCRVIYAQPHFSSEQDGIMPVTILEPDHSFAGTYVTKDAGKSWRASLLRESRAAQHAAVSVFDSHVVRVSVGPEGKVKLRVESTELNSLGLPKGLWPMGAISRADFVNDRNGWLLYSAAGCFGPLSRCSEQVELLSTEDGGKTFRIITPGGSAGTQRRPDDAAARGSLSTQKGPVEPAIRGSRVFLARGPFAEAPATTPQTPDPSGTMISDEQGPTGGGFDQACVPDLTEMQTWWSYSPYYDIGVYLGGSNVNCKNNTYLNSTWVSGTSGAGWGIIPLWVGLQDPCIPSPSQFNLIDPTMAYSQGVSEADAAVSAANSLGIANSIVYYDMEYYQADGSTCSNAAANFIEGWDSEMHTLGFTPGVYWDYLDIGDLTSVSPLPDAAWIKRWDGNQTVWNIGSLSNTYWSNSQRIHQYCSDGTGVPCTTDGLGDSFGTIQFSIDGDAEDAPVVSWSGDRLLSAPTLHGPSDGSTGISVTPTFTWASVTGASSYRIMVATSTSALPTDPTVGTCSGCAINDSPTGTSYTAASGALQAGTKYYWQVHERGEKYGTWSGQWNFSTAPSASTGTINVNATLDGSPWPTSGTGSLAFNLSGPSGLSGSLVPVTYPGMVAGTYTLSYVSGGPSGATLAGIAPSAAQTLGGGGTITFTFDFSSSVTNYTISGQVTLSGVGLSGVSLALGGSAPNTTTTDSSGNYSFTGLASGGNYTITPSLPGYTFSPVDASFTNLNANQTQNFTAVPKKRRGQVISD